MNTTISVRPARKDDDSFLFSMMQELEKARFDAEAFRQRFLANLQHPAIYYWIAESSGNPVGMISLHVQQLLHHERPTGEIQELYVSADQRGQGIGVKLLEEAIRQAQVLSLEELEVTANVARKQTHLFYQRNNFIHSHHKFTLTL